MTRVELVFVGWSDYRPWKARSGSVAGSLAWTIGTTIYVRRGAHRIFRGLQRIGHELEHALDTAFGNAEHHDNCHGCLRQYSWRRSWRHATFATPELARELLRHGHLELP